MKLLALDASTEALSVALLDTTAPHAALEHFEIAPQGHASRLLPAAQALLTRAGWNLADLEGLAFGRGPGAFTGLRIAAGLVQGLAGGLERPVVPVSTLCALAWRCFAKSETEHVRVVQDARMGEIYTADYGRGAEAPVLLGEERVIEPTTLDTDPERTVRAGNGWTLVATARGVSDYNIAEHHPHASDMAWLAAPILVRGEGLPAAEALPVYVRDDVARKSKAQSRSDP